MGVSFQSPKGTKDILPEEQGYWKRLNAVVHELGHVFGYKQLSIPLFEDTALFARGVGEATDIVEKEMYTFLDKGKNSITLRPEFTAGVMRAYIQHGMASRPTPVKLYSMGPIFRYERPQAGRFRQFHQFNAEAVGELDPVLDFEIMDMAWQLVHRLAFKNLSFQLNSIGCPVCRPGYLKQLQAYYSRQSAVICADCRNRLDKNPLRLLDCKQPQCQPVIAEAPAISDHLCRECDDHFLKLRQYLDRVRHPYVLNHRLVRGLDYYTKTVFEVWAEGIGSQNAVCGGGRYDGLIELLGGKPTPGVGFAAGLERIVLIMQNQNTPGTEDTPPRIYFACQNMEAQKHAVVLATQLRRHGISCLMGVGERSFKAQLREADRRKVASVVILGETEISGDTLVLKNMKSGEQTTMKQDKLISFLLKGE
jgi:histidyl-tRNA synthetase